MTEASQPHAPTAPSASRIAADTGAQRIARVYAEALLAVAERHNAVDEVREELDALVNQVVPSNPVIRTFFQGGVVGRKRREAALRAALGGRVSELVLNFLLVLNNHERMELFRLIFGVYADLVEQRANRVRVLVRSAVPLPDDQRQRLIDQLRQITRKEPVLHATVDPDLLGGIVVQVGDWRYDASVRHQIDFIRNQLIESSSHEIQAGRDRFSSDS
jgi:F-type H+-transporting ATPase subunit delta